MSSERGEKRTPAPASMQQRITQLENLVLSMNHSQHPPRLDASEFPDTPDSLQSHLPSSHSDTTDSFGHLSLEEAEVSYVGSNHWTALLDGIAELKEHFGEDHDKMRATPHETDVPHYDGPQLLYGCQQLISSEEILGAIPAKAVADRSLAEYFSIGDVPVVVLHGPTFLEEYERFWQDPAGTPIMWVALLFSVLCLAAIYRQRSVANQSPAPPLPNNQEDLAQKYREKTAQCLVLGQYTRGTPYAIEVLVIYLHTEYLQSPDSHSGYWMLLGVIVRLALRMGYHRDGSYSNTLSLFQAEMRRRIWAILVQLDVISSSQFGLPRMIREEQCDTAEPRNLFDEDINQSMTVLPPSRLGTDLTPIQFVFEKNKIIKVYGAIVDLMTAPKAPSYAEILKLDAVLRSTYKELPPGLQMRPLAKSIMDRPDIIARRFLISMVFEKAKIILHRRYLLSAHSDNRYQRSRTACIDAALQISEYHRMINEEARPGGRFAQYAWRISSFLYEEFLLSTIILCIDLNHSIEHKFSGTDTELQDRMVPALQKSYQIWLGLCETSKEARRASKALSIVLGKLQKGTRTGGTQSESSIISSFDYSLRQLPSFSSNALRHAKFDDPTLPQLNSSELAILPDFEGELSDIGSFDFVQFEYPLEDFLYLN
ncbi:hypothetical protein MMC13_001713 [Lambiella insularis]|nr:hypothetical protein [Lambiella insularis]